MRARRTTTRSSARCSRCPNGAAIGSLLVNSGRTALREVALRRRHNDGFLRPTRGSGLSFGGSEVAGLLLMANTQCPFRSRIACQVGPAMQGVLVKGFFQWSSMGLPEPGNHVGVPSAELSSCVQIWTTCNGVAAGSARKVPSVLLSILTRHIAEALADLAQNRFRTLRAQRAGDVAG